MKTRSKTALFLMELILVIAFFAISTSVCMRIFVYAKTTSDYSRNLSSASLSAQSAAECFKGTNGDVKKTKEMLGARDFENGLRVWYDEKFIATGDEDSACFTLFLVPLYEKGDKNCADISVVDQSGEVLFSLQAKAVDYGK